MKDMGINPVCLRPGGLPPPMGGGPIEGRKEEERI